jgi:hypothetical protein
VSWKPNFKLGLSVAALAIAFAIGATGCSSSGQTQQANDVSQAETLLNNQNYTGAINYLNGVLASNPGDLQLESLLANAYMGRAGLALIPIFNAVMGAQSFSTGLYWQPSCASQAVAALSSLGFECGLYRLLQQLPFSADNPDILQAQTIYRTYFSDPTTTSQEINFVAGTVELSSALTRAAALLNPTLVSAMNYGLSVDPTQFPYDTSIHEAKHLLEELNQALLRFNNSYSLLSQFLSSLNGSTILTMGSQSLTYDGTLQASDFVRFFGSVLQAESITVDQTLSQFATNELHLLASAESGGARLLQAADPTDLTLNGDGSVSVALHTTDYLSDTLNSYASALDGNVQITIFQLAWNQPTPIIQDFLTAAGLSWDAESGASLLNYYSSTGPQWLALQNILNGWDSWLNQDLDTSTQAQVLTTISSGGTPYQSLLSLPGPGTFNPENAVTWMTQNISFLDAQIGAMASPPSLLTTQASQALTLIDETNGWMTQNFYPVPEWAQIQPQQ